MLCGRSRPAGRSCATRRSRRQWRCCSRGGALRCATRRATSCWTAGYACVLQRPRLSSSRSCALHSTRCVFPGSPPKSTYLMRTIFCYAMYARHDVIIESACLRLEDVDSMQFSDEFAVRKSDQIVPPESAAQKAGCLQPAQHLRASCLPRMQADSCHDCLLCLVIKEGASQEAVHFLFIF